MSKKYIPQNQRLNRTVIAVGIISLSAFFLVQFFASEKESVPYSETMIKAAHIMEKAISIIGEYCDKSGVTIDNTMDPNRTGLVFPEHSKLTTSLGHLGAKRTTTNPNVAALIVYLLDRTGVIPGDTIAIGCSASFPALMIGSLAAAKAMEVCPVIIISLGASSYGATDIDFNLLDIYRLLLREGIVAIQPAAVSLGGERDIGEGFGSDIKERLIQQIQLSGIPFIHESDLRKNVSTRMKIYEGSSSDSRISAFINIGGSYANLGISGLALKLKPGLNKKMSIPVKKDRGVLFEMAARNTPIIHLLYIKGLALRYGLPWDPIPLPKPGETTLYDRESQYAMPFWLISMTYFLVVALMVSYERIKCLIKLIKYKCLIK